MFKGNSLYFSLYSLPSCSVICYRAEKSGSVFFTLSHQVFKKPSECSLIPGNQSQLSQLFLVQ